MKKTAKARWRNTNLFYSIEHNQTAIYYKLYQVKCQWIILFSNLLDKYDDANLGDIFFQPYPGHKQWETMSY